MFSSTIVAVALSVLATSASARMISARGYGQGSACNSGSLSCCNSVQSASPEQASSLSGLLGIVVDAGIPIGINCTPISAVVGIGSNQCTQQTVCCENNSFGSSLIGINCTPLNVGV